MMETANGSNWDRRSGYDWWRRERHFQRPVGSLRTEGVGVNVVSVLYLCLSA